MTALTDETLRVLVVDDDDETQFICEGLNSEKHLYEVASRFDVGLERLSESETVDVVIVDFNLDEGTAIDFIERAKAIRPDLPYFIWSASSTRDIQQAICDLPFDRILSSFVVGFVEKRRVRSSTEMAEFIDHGVGKFRHHISAQLDATLSDAFSQLDVALSQTRAVARAIEHLEARPSRRLAVPVRPLKVRLGRVEMTLRRLLGYRRGSEGEHLRAQAMEALEEILARRDALEAPAVLSAAIARLANEQDPHRIPRVRAMLGQALADTGGDEALQRRVAERVNEIVEFMIYSGQPEKAVGLSREVWEFAVGHWRDFPRLSAAITHCCALASSGQTAIAEHLISAALGEVEGCFPVEEYQELARSAYAELDEFANAGVG